ncbi:MAG: DUF4845 domain-containing protein [Gammaproteobacteria bacterium]|nr:DUF4845 domain-containing protein [Gammaproteobacteria bacterium]
MYRLKQQRGMTAIGWLLVLAIIILASLIFIKLVPMYLNTFKITSALNSLKSDPMAQGKPPSELKKLLLNRFNIDMLPDITADEITVTHGDRSYNVRVEHQFKEQMLGDLYVVLFVDESADVPTGQ